MASNMPNTIALRADEDSVPDEANLIGSKTFEINNIISWYKEDYLEGMDAADAWRRHDLVNQWYQWCDRQYPGTKLHNWPDIGSAAGEDVDIRLLIRGYSLAGYSILLFLEACYAVDKALCGTDADALAEVKMWHMPQEMRAYKYLLSEDMMRWWAKELAQLENEIKSPFSNRVSLSWRIRDLSACLGRLEVVMECGDGIGTNIWTTMEENGGSGPPAGLDDAIYDRVDRLKTSVEILRKALERSKQGDNASDMLPPASHSASELGGIRRRIPRAASPSINEHDIGSVRTSTIYEDTSTVTPTPDVTSSVRIASSLGATPPTTGLYYLRSIFRLAMSRRQMPVNQCKDNRLLKWFVHNETTYIISIFFVVMSSCFMVWSVFLAKQQPKTSYEHSPVLDSNFIGNLSQFILSNLSIYLIIVTTVHNPSEGLRYQSWFWICLFASSLFSVLGLSLYSAMPVASIVLLWAAEFAQVVIPVLLATKTGSLEAGIKDDVERHAD